MPSPTSDEFAGCFGGAKAGASDDLGELPLDFFLLVNEQLRVTDYVHEQDVAQSQGPNASVFPRPSNNSKPATAAVPLRFLCVHCFFSAANSWNDLPFLGDGLSAGSLGCGNDLVEALITAQRIPAWIELEIAVGWTGRDLGDNFELLERAVALAGPRVNQR